MMPQFSIVTPSYKQLNWLQLCCASVADQGEIEVEHIVQDGGSGAGLDKIEQDFPHLRLFKEKDEGMYDAINRGLRRASGEICSYLNCDEQYLPGTLKTVSDFFTAHPSVEVLFGDAVLIDQSGRPFSYRRMVVPRLLHSRLAPLGTLTCSTFFRRSILERGHFFDTRWKVIGDKAWVCRLLEEKVCMAALSKPLAVFTFTKANLGDSQAALEERKRWQSLFPFGLRALRPVMEAHHRLRKWLAGAYGTRDCCVNIFTQDSPARRIPFQQSRIPFHWTADYLIFVMMVC